MPRLLLLGLALLPGCSNAPLAGTLDCVFPSRMKPPPVVPDLNRDLDRAPDPIRPIDRRGLPPVEPYPFDDPRRSDRGRTAEPTRRTEPVPRADDSKLPLLQPPGGLDDPLPPPGGR
jgi:hypothetical protein